MTTPPYEMVDRALHQPEFSKARVRITPDHDVIQDLDTKNVASSHESAGELDVGSGRSWIPRWMTVRDHHGRG